MSERDYQEILQDLPRRRNVWVMITDLTFDPPYIDSAVRVCRESGYSWAELDHIARYEVAPAICFSWRHVAFGFSPVYDGIMDPFFDSEWVAERILKRVRRRHHALGVRLLERYMMRHLVENWCEVERRFKSGKGGPDFGVAESSGELKPSD